MSVELKNFDPNSAAGMANCKELILSMKREGSSIQEIAETLMKKARPGSVDINSMYQKVRHQWSRIRRDLTDEEVSEIAVAAQERQCAKSVGTGSGANTPTIKEEHIVSSSGEISEKTVKPEEVNGKTEADLLRLHGFDPEEWELVSHRSSIWESPSDDGTKELCSSRISVRPKRDDEPFDSYFAKTMEEVSKIEAETKIPLIQPKNDGSGDKILILPLADFHLDKRNANIGKISFPAQVARFKKIIVKTMRIAEQQENLGRIVFFWSQDFFNYDYDTETTTSGKNKQDAEAGYRRMVQVGNAMLIWAIRLMEEIAPVEIIYTRSNHDQHTAFNTMQTLYSVFENDDNIIIDNHTAEERAMISARMLDSLFAGVDCEEHLFRTNPRKYVRWGQCLFGFAHGDKEKHRIFSLMQHEAAEQFCANYAFAHNIPWEKWKGSPSKLPMFENKYPFEDTTVHEFFLGHYHSKQVSKDEGSVEATYCGSDMSGDNWHAECGYVGAQRKTEISVYSKNGDSITYALQSANLDMEEVSA